MGKLAVFFPGIGYHCDKPLLYYSQKLVKLMGYDESVCLKYSYDGGNIKGNREKMEEAFHALYQQTQDGLKDIDFEKYEEVVFISKSIGTIIAAAYEMQNKMTCKNVFFTPLEDTFSFQPKGGIAFTGTADNWVCHENIVELCRQYALPLHIYLDANHSLETGKVDCDLQEMEIIMNKVKEYLA